MAIARVRIAPIEQWRDIHPDQVGNLSPGKLVDIDISSCHWETDIVTGDRFRSWRLVGESLTWLHSLPGVRPTDNCLCEHLLEMD